MIQRAGAAKLGFTVALVEDSLHEWEVKMFGFDVKVGEEARSSCVSLLRLSLTTADALPAVRAMVVVAAFVACRTRRRVRWPATCRRCRGSASWCVSSSHPTTRPSRRTCASYGHGSCFARATSPLAVPFAQRRCQARVGTLVRACASCGLRLRPMLAAPHADVRVRDDRATLHPAAMTVESVLISVRTNMVVGGGRIDLRNKTDYSAREAKVAFDRMMVSAAVSKAPNGAERHRACSCIHDTICMLTHRLVLVNCAPAHL